MLTELDNYYDQQKEPIRGCLLALREIILGANENVVMQWKYQLPMFSYKGKNFCYIHVGKKEQIPYLGIVHGHKINRPKLIKGNRKQMKAFYVNPEEDIPVEKIYSIFKEAFAIIDAKLKS